MNDIDSVCYACGTSSDDIEALQAWRTTEFGALCATCAPAHETPGVEIKDLSGDPESIIERMIVEVAFPHLPEDVRQKAVDKLMEDRKNSSLGGFNEHDEK